MAYFPVPIESKGAINKAGEILKNENGILNPKYDEALELANRWRACHSYPINTFQATLRDKIKRLKFEGLVAQRLKRMPTIIDKLKRHQNMKLTTMQDIAGVRAILHSIDDVNNLVDSYTESKHFQHNLIKEYDYISKPRNQDGYRSIHLVYKYRKNSNPTYDGLRIEMQFRSRLQHIWATAVETMGTFLDQALKSKQGDEEWLDFFALVSSAFSFFENAPQVPRFSNLTQRGTFELVAKKENELNVMETMKSISGVVKSMGEGKSYTYHLLVLHRSTQKIEIYNYDRDNLPEALNKYEQLESKAIKFQIDPVLVSAGPMENLRKAYPNLFLDISEFQNFLNDIIDHYI